MIYKVKFSYRLKDSFSMEWKQPIALMVMRDRFDQFLVERHGERCGSLRRRQCGKSRARKAMGWKWS